MRFVNISAAALRLSAVVIAVLRTREKCLEKLPGATQQSRQLSWRLFPAGDVVFQEVRMLQAGELDGEAVFEMTHDAALHFAERNQRADRRPLVAGDTGAGLRHVDNAAGEVDA